MLNAGIDTEEKYVKMKKDVYEHLANTFLDKKRNKRNPKKINFRFYVGIISVIYILGLYVIVDLSLKSKVFSRSLSLIQGKEPVTVDYSFAPSAINKIITLTFNLSDLDLSKFRFIKLVARTNDKTKIDSTVKIQIENSRSEKDYKFISGINGKWKTFYLNLSNFKTISDWTNVKSLSFIVEEWNVPNKKDKIFIDDLRFIE